jgi:hypothetical protein
MQTPRIITVKRNTFNIIQYICVQIYEKKILYNAVELKTVG